MSENSLAIIERASIMLAEANTIQQTKELKDLMLTVSDWAKRRGMGEETIQRAREYSLLAERKMGELLKATERHPGGRPKTCSTEEQVLPPKLPDLGITRKEASEAQFLSELSEKEFAEVRAGEKTITEIRREKVREQNRQEKVSRPIPKGLFNIILADPPWQYEHEISDSRKIENQYPTMKLEEIATLSIPAADDSVLFLWATNPKLKEALWVMEKWGFDYRTNLVWAKDKIGMGFYFRSQHELLLVGKKGNYPMPEPSNRPSSLVTFPRLDHSKKPSIIYNLIETMYPEAKKLELFQRGEPRPDWAVWSNE